MAIVTQRTPEYKFLYSTYSNGGVSSDHPVVLSELATSYFVLPYPARGAFVPRSAWRKERARLENQ